MARGLFFLWPLGPGLALCGLAGPPWALGGRVWPFFIRSRFIPDEGMAGVAVMVLKSVGPD